MVERTLESSSHCCEKTTEQRVKIKPTDAMVINVKFTWIISDNNVSESFPDAILAMNHERRLLVSSGVVVSPVRSAGSRRRVEFFGLS